MTALHCKLRPPVLLVLLGFKHEAHNALQPANFSEFVLLHTKLHTGFRLVPKLVTLNRAMAVSLRYFTEFGSIGSQLHHSG